jgi:hypothetical protein
MRVEGLVLSERSRIDVSRMLNQVRLLLSEEGILLLRSQRRCPLARPHVDGTRPWVLWGRPGATGPAGVGVGGQSAGGMATGGRRLAPLATALAVVIGGGRL